MKHLLLTLLVTVFSFGFAVPEAEAKRLGGGSSFGMQRQMTPPSAPRQPATAQQRPQTQQPAAANSAAKPRSSWMGPLAGLAAGLGLAALFSHLGMGEEFGSLLLMLLMAAGAFFLFRMFFRRNAASATPAYAGATPQSPMAFDAQQPLAGSSAPEATAANPLPADFDAAGFAREAKVQFIRLQAAHDAGNLEDIRDFTTPEMFAEIRMQFSERAPGEQRTDVVELNAEVVEVSDDGKRHIVSVRFNGLLREEADSAPAPFDEVWHLVKPMDDSRGWVIAGIQQVG
jgi:predicted lipid-binding transport protein (Tim44 family)